MNYIITADIKGFKYFIKIEDVAHHGAVLKFSYQGLKNNATVFNYKDYALGIVKKIDNKSDWELRVEEA
jgi:hypothetical protein